MNALWQRRPVRACWVLRAIDLSLSRACSQRMADATRSTSEVMDTVAVRAVL